MRSIEQSGNFEPNSVEITEQNETKSKLGESLKNVLGEKARALLLLALSTLPMVEGRAQTSTMGGNQETSTSSGPTGKRVELKQRAEPGAEKSELDWPGMHHTFFKSENGEWRFNPWAFIAPLQLEFSNDNKADQGMTIEVPYEFSRLFDTGQPLREEDHEKIVDYMEEKIKDVMADQIYAFNMNEEVYNSYHPQSDKERPKVKELKLAGTASPEALKYGGDSLKPGNIEQENLALAKIRSEKGAEYVKQALSESGFDVSNIKDIEFLPSEEIQLNDSEIAELSGLASEYEGKDDWDKMANLVFDYNHGEVTNPDVLSKLDKIMAEKRTVKINVTLEGGNKDVLIIPIPLFLLALLALRNPFKRRIREAFSKKEHKLNPEKPMRWETRDGKSLDSTPLETPKSFVELQRVVDGSENAVQKNKVIGQERVEANFQEVGELERVVDGSEEAVISAEEKMEVTPSIYPMPQEVLSKIPRFAREVPLPEENSELYRTMREHTILQDLYDNFDNKETIGYGINYREYAEALNEHYDEFKDANERELYVTAFIVSAWMGADLAKRKEAGVDQDQLFEGLDYYNDPKQVQWAKMHARSISELVEQHRAYPDDYMELLDKTATQLAFTAKRRELDN